MSLLRRPPALILVGTAISVAALYLGAWWVPFPVGLLLGLLVPRARFSIPAGHRLTVTVRITRAGRGLFASRRRLQAQDSNAARNGIGITNVRKRSGPPAASAYGSVMLTTRSGVPRRQPPLGHTGAGGRSAALPSTAPWATQS